MCTPDFFGFNKDLGFQYRAARRPRTAGGERTPRIIRGHEGGGGNRTWSGGSNSSMMSIVEAALKNRHPMLERGSPLRDVAKKEVMPRYLKVAHQRKSDGSLFTEADIAAQEALSRRLPEIYSGPIVAEEMTAEQQAEYWLAGTEGLWCVDPIDGTSNFVNGLPYFAVSVALMKEGKSVLGVVYDPFADEVFYAEKGGGAFLNGERLPIKQQSPLLRGAMAQVDFNRLPDRLARDLVASPPSSPPSPHTSKLRPRSSQEAQPPRMQ